MLEDTRGLDVFGTLTDVPGKVTLSLGADGTIIASEGSCVSVVTFSIDGSLNLYIEVSRGADLWNLDGKPIFLREPRRMWHRGTFLESRACFNNCVCFRWSANFLSDFRLRLLAEKPTAVTGRAQIC